jgi:hypothetical protein
MSIEAIKHYEAALLKAFPRGATGDVFEHWNKARQAIAEAEKQEPVGYFKREGDAWVHYYEDYPVPSELTALYTTPQQRTWVGLTDEEMHECAGEFPWTPTGLKRVRAIEAKLKEKNNG